ncbi:hypothetical protein FBU59_003822 [Linderina macrospora]|uniref:Uncharacterized protein n=1 Tax=Linderina macrospora TaxID=4868 RepID=A0ACC1J7G5_9FUNG|nr:hypothetical protein FBU59_003822 [Linderina macrospora]
MAVYPEFATFKGIGGSRAERVARRSDPVPLEIQGHIVICDASNMFPRNIELLVQALKQAFEDDELPIVILSPAKMDRVVELVLSDFANVYVVRGTPLSQADLRRTHIGHAQKAIVLGSCGGRADKDTGDSSNDSAAILANLNIQSVCGGQFFVTTELLDIESIRYHDHTQLLGEPLLKRTFMGGHIFMPALIDTALCQCYFSSHILEVLRQMTFSHADAGPLRTFKPGRLSLLYVPDRFIGKRYDTLVLTLMKRHGAIPLGIYRIVSQRGQAFACVLSNPPPYMPLLSSDAVYVLAPIIPGWKHVTEGLRNLRIEPQSNLSGSTGQTTSPASAGTDKNGKGSGTNQSRHTVYFHDTLDHSNDEADNGDIADVEVSDDANRNTGTAIPTRPESKMA